MAPTSSTSVISANKMSQKMANTSNMKVSKLQKTTAKPPGATLMGQAAPRRPPPGPQKVIDTRTAIPEWQRRLLEKGGTLSTATTEARRPLVNTNANRSVNMPPIGTQAQRPVRALVPGAPKRSLAQDARSSVSSSSTVASTMVGRPSPSTNKTVASSRPMQKLKRPAPAGSVASKVAQRRPQPPVRRPVRQPVYESEEEDSLDGFIVDDDEEETVPTEAVRQRLRKITGYNPRKFNEGEAMVASSFDVAREEKLSMKLARVEDRREHLAERERQRLKAEKKAAILAKRKLRKESEANQKSGVE